MDSTYLYNVQKRLSVMSVKGKLKSGYESAKSRAKVAHGAGQMMAENRTGESFTNDNSGQMASRAVNLVVGLTVGGLVAAFLLPIAIDEIVSVDTTSWGSGASSLWDILDVIVVLSVFLFFISLAVMNRRA
jgi:hypothetical protein